jgi:hypothetical protein
MLTMNVSVYVSVSPCISTHTNAILFSVPNYSQLPHVLSTFMTYIHVLVCLRLLCDICAFYLQRIINISVVKCISSVLHRVHDCICYIERCVLYLLGML